MVWPDVHAPFEVQLGMNYIRKALLATGAKDEGDPKNFTISTTED
jgi:hypothetical protein